MKLSRKLKIKWAGWMGPLPRPKRWVFIVGCYNSGTTLLHDMLATHPSVGSMAWEGQFFTDQFPLPLDVGLPRLWALAPERFRLGAADGAEVDVSRLKRQWGARINHPDRPILIEKSPTNAGRTRWLEAHFEDAHFIGIVRNGYAVAEGIRRKAGHDIALGARQWAASNEIMLADFPSLRRSKLIRYEDLAENTSGLLREIGEFIGLEMDEVRGLDEDWSIHGHVRPIANLNANSFASLTPEDADAVRREAGGMLARLGYDAEVPVRV